MALPTIAEQKLDVYDVIMGGDDAYDPAETPVFNMLPNGPDSPQAAKFQFVFDAPDAPDNSGSAEGGQWDQGGLTTFGDPSRLYGRMHHQKYMVGAGEVTDGDQGYGMQGLSTFQYQVKKCMRRLVKDAELICIGPQENQAGSTVAQFKTRGLELYILDTTLIALQTDGDTDIEAAVLPATAQVKEVTTGTGAFAFEESDLQAMVNAAYNSRQAKIKWDGWCTTRLKNLISNWGNLAPTVGSYTNVRRFNSSADALTMKTTFQKWIGDAGEVDLDLHPFLRLNTTTQKAEGLFLMKGMQTKRMRRNPSVVKMSDDAGVKRAYGMMTFGLQCIPKYNGQVRRAAA
jgi:hypothetical protein